MGRSFFLKSIPVSILIAALAGLSACGKKASTPIVVSQVTLTTTSPSLEPGQTFSVNPRATDSTGATLGTQVFTFNISNPASPQTPPPTYVSIASVGIGTSRVFTGCAGQWNSLTLPTICTPGPAGIVQISASAGDANSNPVTLYIHQHVERIVVAPVAANPPACLSARNSLGLGDTEDFQATAYSNGLDVTSSVGPISWAATATQVVSTSTSGAGLQSNQARVSAKTPGSSLVYASIASNSNASTTSAPVTVNTCAVQSITVSVQNTNDTSFIVTKGTGSNLQATVLDTLGNQLTNVPLTWLTSRPTVMTVTGGSPSGSSVVIPAAVTTTNVGGAAITAICAPPGCNSNLNLPPLYSNVIIGTVTGAPNTIAGFVTGTGCTGNAACTTSIFPFGQSAAGSNLQLGNSAVLPSPPNSMLMDSGGKKIFLGSNDGMAIVDPGSNPPAVTVPNTSVGKVTGKVLAASPNAAFAIVSNTAVTPNVVWVVDVANPNINTKILNLDGVTAAAYTPDSSKVYMIGGSKLYVYSATAPLQTLALAAAGSDVNVLGNSQFVYASQPTGVAPFATCADAPAAAVTTAGAPAAIRATADGTSVIAADSPNLDVITATITLAGNPPAIGCPPIVSHNVTPVPLSIGSFTVRKMEVAADSHSVFLITNEFNNVLVYNLQTQSIRALPIVNNASLLDASLSSDGNSFLVGASDGMIHYLTLQTGDLQQIPINPCTGVGVAACNPDLVVIRP